MLLLTADDFGLCQEINKAICLLHDNGTVNRTSVMVNTELFDESVELLMQRPKLEVGIHLNLTDGKPVSARRLVPTLLREGAFIGGRHYAVAANILAGKFDKEQIKLEWRSQIHKLHSSGLAVKHLNSHGHIHLIPALHGVICELIEEFSIPYVRLIFSGRSAKSVVFRYCSHLLLSKIKKINDHVKYPDRILGIDHQGKLNKDIITRELSSLAAGSTSEFILHPAIGDNPYHRSWAYNTKEETDSLLDKDVAREIAGRISCCED